MSVLQWMLSDLMKYSTAVLALAALASPFIALFAAMQVSRIHVKTAIAGHRQNWINELRHEVATALTNIMQATSEKSVALPQEKRLATLAALNLHVNKIKLLINPAEEDHKALGELFQ